MEVIPNSQFTIKRTAYKDSSSEYYIDDRLVSFKDVQALLINCGVDLEHNRFLILQVILKKIVKVFFLSLIMTKGRSRANFIIKTKSCKRTRRRSFGIFGRYNWYY